MSEGSCGCTEPAAVYNAVCSAQRNVTITVKKGEKEQEVIVSAAELGAELPPKSGASCTPGPSPAIAMVYTGPTTAGTGIACCFSTGLSPE